VNFLITVALNSMLYAYSDDKKFPCSESIMTRLLRFGKLSIVNTYSYSINPFFSEDVPGERRVRDLQAEPMGSGLRYVVPGNHPDCLPQ
jgi:hypothetical protein